MSIVVNDGFRVNAPKPIDIRYMGGVLNNTPYASVAAANTAITSTRRHIGLTVNINNEEYRYKEGILDSDLVLKTSGGSNLRVEKPFTNVTTVTINHNFGKYPGSVNVYDASGDEVFVQVANTSINQTVCDRNVVASGTVVLLA